MFYRLLADFVVLIHSMIVFFFFSGVFLAWWYPGIGLLHIPLAIWVTCALSMGWVCPLTPLENRLRKAAGGEGYQGSFVEQYIAPLAGLAPFESPSPVSDRTERTIGVVIGLVMLAFHAANYHQYCEILGIR